MCVCVFVCLCVCLCFQSARVHFSLAWPPERQTGAAQSSGRHPHPRGVPVTGLHPREGQPGTGTAKVLSSSELSSPSTWQPAWPLPCSFIWVFCLLFQAGKRTRPDRSVHLWRHGKPDSGGERQTFHAGTDACYFHRFCHGPKMIIFTSFEQFIVKFRKA